MCIGRTNKLRIWSKIHKWGKGPYWHVVAIKSNQLDAERWDCKFLTCSLSGAYCKSKISQVYRPIGPSIVCVTRMAVYASVKKEARPNTTSIFVSDQELSDCLVTTHSRRRAIVSSILLWLQWRVCRWESTSKAHTLPLSSKIWARDCRDAHNWVRRLAAEHRAEN